MTELNDLFEQIFHSERNFRARTDQLKALNVKIQDVQFKLEQSKEELHTRLGELAVKNSKLADVEMEVKLLQLRKDILQAQKNDITEAKSKIFKDYQEIVSTLATERQLFMKELKEFSCCYDLHGSGLKYREEEDKKNISILQDELILLETELVEIDSYREDIKMLQQELSDVESKLSCEKDKGRELKVKQLEQEDQIQKLKKEKIFNNKVSNNSDLSRLQSELDTCNDSHEEKICKELSKELEELQKECYHKQMKLQVARQNKKTSTPNDGKRGYHYTHQQHTPQHDLYAYENDHTSNINLIDDEWLEAAALDDFDSDENECMEGDEWDIDIEELEQNMILDSQSNDTELDEKISTNSPQKIFPAASFASCRSIHRFSAKNAAEKTEFQMASTLALTSGTSVRSKLEQREVLSKALHTKSNLSSSLAKPPPACSLVKGVDIASYCMPSPSPNSIPRKRPGESIFKTQKSPHTSSQISDTKKGKKVRFH